MTDVGELVHAYLDARPVKKVRGEVYSTTTHKTYWDRRRFLCIHESEHWQKIRVGDNFYYFCQMCGEGPREHPSSS